LAIECLGFVLGDLSNYKEMFLLTTEKKITTEGLKKISSGLLPTGTLLLSSRAPVGYLSLTTFKLAINQGYIAIKLEL
jgi:type I restriction enzyme S subunit